MLVASNEIKRIYMRERTRIIQYIMILLVITRGDYGHVTWRVVHAFWGGVADADIAGGESASREHLRT